MKAKPAALKSKSHEPHDAIYDGLDLPDDEFDYDEFVPGRSAATTVDLHACALGGTGHEPCEEA